MIRAGGEGSGNDDRGLDAPAIQLCGIADRERIHGCLRREVSRFPRESRYKPGQSHPGASLRLAERLLLVDLLHEIESLLVRAVFCNETFTIETVLQAGNVSGR